MCKAPLAYASPFKFLEFSLIFTAPTSVFWEDRSNRSEGVGFWYDSSHNITSSPQEVLAVSGSYKSSKYNSEKHFNQLKIVFFQRKSRKCTNSQKWRGLPVGCVREVNKDSISTGEASKESWDVQRNIKGAKP